MVWIIAHCGPMRTQRDSSRRYQCCGSARVADGMLRRDSDMLPQQFPQSAPSEVALVFNRVLLFPMRVSSSLFTIVTAMPAPGQTVTSGKGATCGSGSTFMPCGMLRLALAWARRQFCAGNFGFCVETRSLGHDELGARLSLYADRLLFRSQYQAALSWSQLRRW
jgi:hypothetical protein